jgi:hypothetical protein
MKRITTARGKSSISKDGSYREMGKFWDEHDLTEFWDKTRKAKFTAPRRTKTRKSFL